MARREDPLQARLERDLAELKLPEIAKAYREVLDDAARKGSSMLEVLATLMGLEQAARQQRALERRLREARLLRLEDVAARLGVAPSTLSRIETGLAPARTS